MAGVEIATAYVNLVSSAKGLGQSITGEIESASSGADAAGNKAGSKFGGAFGKAASLIGTVGIGAFLADSVKSLSNIESINAQTASAIQTTGGAAQVTSQHVQDLALSLESMSAQEREGIQSGANFLLTFKNIKNGVGAGNDIFDQTTQAMVDLSVATGTDMQGAALQLGKALNDPIAGVGALSRVGVTFTAQQKDQIKAMQTAGDTAGAQKVILAELNSEFGGSGAAAAKTFAGRMYFLTDAIGGVGEAIVGKAMGPLGGLAEIGTKIANAAADWITNFDVFGGSLGRVGSIAAQAFSILGKGDFKGLAGLQEDSPLVNGLFLIRQGAQDAASALRTMATGDFTGMNFFNEDSPLVRGLIAIHQGAQDAWGALDVIVSGHFSSLNGLNFFDNNSPFVKGLFAAHEKVVGLAGSLRTELSGAFEQAKPKLAEFGATIGPALSGAFDKLKPVLATVGGSILDNLRTMFAQIGPVLSSLAGTLGPVFSNLMSGLGPVFAQIGPVIGQLLPLLNPVSFVLKSLLPILPQLADAFGQIAIAVSAGLGQALAAIAPMLPVVANILGQIAAVIAQGLVQAVQGLLPLFNTLVGVITTLIPPIMALVLSLLPPLMGVFQSLVPLVSAVVSVVVDLVNTLVGVLIPVINALLPVVVTIFGFIADFIRSALDVIKGVIEVVTGIITGNWTLVWNGILGIVTGVWNAIEAVVNTAIAIVTGVLSAAWAVIASVAASAWNSVKDSIMRPLQAAWDWISGAFQGIIGAVGGVWASIQSGVVTGLGAVYNAIIKPFQEAYDWVVGKLTGLRDWVKGIWNDITSFFSKPIQANVVVNSQGVAGINTNLGGGLPTFGTGGYVTKPTIGMIGEGQDPEFVVPKPTLQSWLRAAAFEGSQTGASSGIGQVVIHNQGPDLSPEAFNAGYREWERRYGYGVA